MAIPVTPFSGSGHYVYVAPTTQKNDVNSDCTVGTINKLIRKNILNSIDERIIEHLGNYYILNYNLLVTLINDEYGLNFEFKGDYCDNLLKLRKLGIIGMYKKQDPEQAVYVLSEGANIYYHLCKNEKRARTLRGFPEEISADKINHIVSINSLYIHAHSKNGVKLKKHSIKSDTFRFMSINLKWIKINFAALSVRRGDDFIKNILDCNNKAEKYFKKNIYIILLCEDSKHIMEINKKFKESPICSFEHIYYTTDRESSMNAFCNLYIGDEKESNTIHASNIF